jgi:hypothetical protein
VGNPNCGDEGEEAEADRVVPVEGASGRSAIAGHLHSFAGGSFDSKCGRFRSTIPRTSSLTAVMSSIDSICSRMRSSSSGLRGRGFSAVLLWMCFGRAPDALPEPVADVARRLRADVRGWIG